MSTFVEKLRQYSKPGYYDEFDYHWTMTIDLDRCTGCEACVVACQAENNLPIVGEERFAESREIKWIRIERYWEGEYPDVKMGFIPMLCQQCDDAPCETACPVYATYHNQDGLNTQIYNRCIGTRTCAVYCPYEVRYFNWFTYKWDEPLEQQLNPDVSVREKVSWKNAPFASSASASPKTMRKMMTGAGFVTVRLSPPVFKAARPRRWYSGIAMTRKPKCRK